jgi:predicted DNA-binding transcriptional regulator AlpA
MPVYDFSLNFALPSGVADPAAFLDVLFVAGCDDATVGVGRRGAIGLAFSREAVSAEIAVRSGIAAVEQAIPGASLVEAKPDLVNLSDAAELLGMSRQNMRKYASGDIRGVAIPFPLPTFQGSPSLWHLSEILTWLSRHTELQPPQELQDLARVVDKVNLEAQEQRLAQVESMTV